MVRSVVRPTVHLQTLLLLGALKANTVKRRTYSLFRQGGLYYQAIPNMPEHRLQPLVERFALLVCQQPVFREVFGLI
jgi:hypothetical protein